MLKKLFDKDDWGIQLICNLTEMLLLESLLMEVILPNLLVLLG